MEPPRFRRFSISRESRVAIVFGLLIATAGAAAYQGQYESAVLWGIFAFAVVAAFYFLFFRPAWIPRDAVVMVRLEGALREETGHSPLEQLLGRGFPSMAHLRYALEAAARDTRVRAVVVEVGGLQNGMATAEELHELLRGLRAAGKQVIAVLRDDFASVRDYVVAAGAGEVVMNPDTMLAMLGVAAGSVFLKRALDKLNVRVQTLQWKQYKGAAETVSRETMSAELRESLEAVIGEWRDVLVKRIASARKLEPERARELSGMGFMSARSAREAGLVDREGYTEDIRAEFDPEGTRKPFVSLARYMRHAVYVNERGERPRIAVVYGTGPVITGQPPAAGEFISGEATSAQIDRASRDPMVAAIVFRVNSPGGSAVGSDLVWRAVRDAQTRGKPVVVSMGDVAASGGYYLATGADWIVAQPGTITGSIGVFAGKLVLAEAKRRVGISTDEVHEGRNALITSPNTPFSPSERERFAAFLDAIYADFVASVAEGRSMPLEAVEEVARGRIWTGADARAAGLVDALGGFPEALAAAREKAGIDPAARVRVVRVEVRARGLAGFLPAPGGAWSSIRLRLPPGADHWTLR